MFSEIYEYLIRRKRIEFIRWKAVLAPNGIHGP